MQDKNQFISIKDKYQHFRTQIALNIKSIRAELLTWKNSSWFVEDRNNIEQSLDRIENVLTDTSSPLKNWDNGLLEAITKELDQEKFSFCFISLNSLRSTIKKYEPNIITAEQTNIMIEQRENLVRIQMQEIDQKEGEINNLTNILNDPEKFKDNLVVEIQKPIFCQLDITNKLLEQSRETVDILEKKLEEQTEKLTDTILNQNNSINEQSIQLIEQNQQINSMGSSMQWMQKELLILMKKNESKKDTMTADNQNSFNKNSFFESADIQDDRNITNSPRNVNFTALFDV